MAVILSVVLPIYNGEKFLAEAVESILQQTYSDFELLAINDGSKDRSAEILEGFRQRDSRIRVVTQPQNMGLIAALNLGCELSTGRYIARMDADDVCLPQRFEKQLQYLEANPQISIVGSALWHIDEFGHLGAESHLPVSPGHLRWCMIFGSYLAHPSVMMRRDVLSSIGFYRPEAYRIEDYDLWTRVLNISEVANMPDILLKYRTHSQSSMVSSKPAVEDRATEIVQTNIERLLKKTIKSEEVRWLRAIDNPGDGVAPVILEAQISTEKLLYSLFDIYVQSRYLDHDELMAIKQDVAWKLFILAELSFGNSPIRSINLLRKAIFWSPHSIYGAATIFVHKIIRKVRSAAGQNRYNSSPH